MVFRHGRRRRSLVGVVLVAALAAIDSSAMASAPGEPSGPREKEEDALRYYDIRSLRMEGQGWTDLEAPFDRLPRHAKSRVRPRIWQLSRNPAGLCARFVTDATAIHARWTVGPELAMAHMPATGVSGLDLYVRNINGRWRRLAVGVPEGTTASATLVEGLAPDEREYLLYLPLYNTVSSVEIGVAAQARLAAAPPRPASKAKPIVFYGTSITQGGCASRPGMCHAAILGRRFDRPVVNLGFSSNGTMDLELAELLAELDAAVYVVDCLPNMNAAMVSQRAEPFVRAIRAKRPTTPILLVEDRTFSDAFLISGRADEHAAKRQALRRAFDKLSAEGDANLAYVSGDDLLAADGEDTVDGSHPTDLGFVHLADALQPTLENLLEQSP